jgi:hypothetical protein
VLDRLSRTIARAPRHRRPTLVATAQRIRAAISRAHGAGAERILQDLVRSPAEDDAWVHSVDAFAAIHTADDLLTPKSSSTILALILLQHGDNQP